MLEIKNVNKKYKNNIALNNINLLIGKNKIVGILGQNGAGKTTLMDIICACRVSDSGSVSINNIELASNPDKYKTMVSYMPECVPLYNDFTIIEYLRFVAGIRKVCSKDTPTHLEEVMRICNIFDVRYRLIANISKGYKQRVGIAQALVGNSDLLVLDEPTVGLDPKQIVDILDLIKKLSKDHTILISSHRLYEIQSICDEYIILHKGHIKHRATINNNTSTNIELAISSKSTDILQEIKNLPFVYDISNIENKTIDNTNIIEMLITTKGELLPEKTLNTLLISKGYYIYKISRISANLERIFLSVTKE